MVQDKRVNREREEAKRVCAWHESESEPKNVNSEIIREILSYYREEEKECITIKHKNGFDDEADKYFAKHKGALEIILRERIRAEGLEKGLEEGKKEGIEEGKLESLISLVKDGDLPLDKVIKKSGLSEEEIKKRLKES